MKDPAIDQAAECIEAARHYLHEAYSYLEDDNGQRYSEKIGKQFGEVMEVIEDLSCRIETLTPLKPRKKQQDRTK